MKRYIKANFVPIFAKHVRYDEKAADILTKSKLFDSETSNQIIQSLFNEKIHAFSHSKNWLEKYLKGIARIIIEESHGDPKKAIEFIESCPQTFNTYISYVKKLRDKLGGTSYDDYFINEMSYKDVQNAIEDLSDDYYDEIDISNNQNARNYTLIPIKDYDELHAQFGGHWTGDGEDEDGVYAGHGGTAWCHANNEYTYHQYTRNGKNKFFVLAANNWQDILFDAEETDINPKNEYGNSLIALVVGPHGNLINSTLRSNHVGEPPGDPDLQYNYAQLSAIAGFDVPEKIKEYLDLDGLCEYVYQNEKYGMLANDYITVGTHTLYRIQALKTVRFGVESGDIGGYIESLKNLSEFDSCWVCDDACVYGDARISEDALIADNARVFNSSTVFGYARVLENARICGESKVLGHSKIYGRATITDTATVSRDAEVYDDAIVGDSSFVTDCAKVYEMACIGGKSQIYAYAEVKGSTHIYDHATIRGYASVSAYASVYGYATIEGDAKIYSTANIGDNARISENAEIAGFANVFRNSYVHGNAVVTGQAAVEGNAEVYEFARIIRNARVFGNAKVHGHAIISDFAEVDYDVSEGTIF